MGVVELPEGNGGGCGWRSDGLGVIAIVYLARTRTWAGAGARGPAGRWIYVCTGSMYICIYLRMYVPTYLCKMEDPAAGWLGMHVRSPCFPNFKFITFYTLHWHLLLLVVEDLGFLST